MLMDEFSDQEMAILLATRISENAMTLAQLAETAEIRIDQAYPVICSLVRRGILEPSITYEKSVVYIYQENERAQAAYDEIGKAESRRRRTC